MAHSQGSASSYKGFGCGGRENIVYHSVLDHPSYLNLNLN